MPAIASLQELAELLCLPGVKNAPVKGFCFDSREVKPGDVFCAIKGAKNDGHDFVEIAFEKGAVAAIVEKNCSAPNPLFVVQDVTGALQKLAQGVLERSRPLIVAVTGSVGKTTTKDFIGTLLEGRFRVWKSPGNNNSQLGLPVAILNSFNGTETIAVVEMGMTHPGQIEKLVQIAAPDIALITQVLPVHIANFSSLADIAKAKAEIFSNPKTQLGIYHREIDNLLDLSDGLPKKKFSLNDASVEFSLKRQGNTLILLEEGKSYPLGEFKLPGDHNLHNLLAALGVARAAGLSVGEIRSKIPFLTLPRQRMEKVEKKGVIFVNDSYNACVASVKAALRCLPEPKNGGKKIGVLGSMLELGAFSDRSHRDVGEDALAFIDYLICHGAECLPMVEVWKAKGKNVEEIGDHEAIAERLRSLTKEGDVILLKGSRSKAMWKVMEYY